MKKKHQNKIYDQYSKELEKINYTKQKNYDKMINECMMLGYTLESLRQKYSQITDGKPPEALIGQLPVENLWDSFECEKFKKPLKKTYEDYLSGSKIKKVARETLSEHEDKISKTKIFLIEMLESQIRFLLKKAG